ncbi:hypothetical protein K435DRAFT_958955 [Dendrothele bispora CBS 962.96]|uniref:CCD97-like C-terminal domain-containing protein n=1 Tax=Dendrothele bispora (strain CBS 962.96) TaxID=1314807 RepID=A0A4S8N029_DENBC|nr:hypothetical protein K435DRAFT_958955 [Dendrothele bispora CBS 962.96]
MDESLILKYLGLPNDYQPSPTEEPANFLIKHLSQLPPHLSAKFSSVVTPKQRTIISAVRNRRLNYTRSNPTDLSFANAKHEWPNLWQGRERRGVEEGSEEKQWAENSFMEGAPKHVKKLGSLLGGYEEEREAERVRTLRREQMVAQEDEFVPEEDESDSELDEAESRGPEPDESEADAKMAFERRIHELFIYGLLERYDYDKVDWDENLDAENDRELEERWFDEEDED